MVKRNDLPPEEFIKQVLNMYYNEKYSVKAIALYFDVGTVVIRRVIKQYTDLKTKPILFIEAPKKKKSKIKELDDKVRKDKDKITQEDFTDLEIDLKLFEKGKEPDEEK